MRSFLSITMSGAFVGCRRFAAEMKVSVEIPRLNVAEYHRPYVAVWLEKPDQTFVGNLAVWYDLKLKDNEGTKWLKDMRQWWRKSGRELEMPVDGLSSATRAPGEHPITFALDKAPVKDLAPANITWWSRPRAKSAAARLLRVPFQWPAKAADNPRSKASTSSAQVALDLKP